MPTPPDRVVAASRRVWLAVGCLLLAVAVWHLLARPLATIAIPTIYALLLVQLLNPAVTWLQRRGVNRTLGTLAVYVAIVVTVAGAGRLVVPTVTSQVGTLVDQLPLLARDLQDNVNSLVEHAGGQWRVSLDLRAQETQDALLEWLQGGQGEVGALLGGISNVAGTLLRTVTVLLVGPVVAFYLLVDLPRLQHLARRWLPARVRAEVLTVAGRVSDSVAAYIRGQLALSALVGLLAAIGCWAIGLPFFAVVGVIAGLTNVIPLVGPFIGGAFGGVVALSVGDGAGQLLAVVAVVAVVQQIDNHLLSPYIVGRVVQLHPATVILALTVAATVGGVPAMVVAIPLVATAKLVVRHLLVEHTELGRQAATGPYATARAWRSGRRRGHDHPMDDPPRPA